MLNCLFVGLGGAIGSILRYLIGLIPVKENFSFPVKTFFINIIGCFVIGFVVSLNLKNNLNPKLLLFLKVGVCGGFTTYSTFGLETFELIKSGQILIAILYTLLSLIIGISFVYIAYWITNKI